MRLQARLPALFAGLSSAASILDASSFSQSVLGSSSSSSAPHYRDTLLALHKSLVEIPSVTGTENAVGQFLVNYLTDLGLQAELQFVPPAATSSTDEKPRFNVIAWPGKRTKPSPKILVSSHIDTVPPFIPYSISDSDNVDGETKISGRGSVDAKAAVAAQITALLDLMQSKEHDDFEPEDVMLLYVVDEESVGEGMRYFSGSLDKLDPRPQFQAAIFGEPTEGKLACGHKGFLGCTIKATGRAGHSGYPWLGKSANEVLMRGLVKVLDTDLGSSERLGNTTVNVGRIEGGVALNVIPEKAEARLAVRIAIGPQETGAKVVEGRIRDIFTSVDEEAFDISCNNGYGAINCNCEVAGFENITVNYGTDVANLKGEHTRYLYGPGTILVAHGPDEALKVKDLEAAVEGYKKLILHALEH
jgi:acetylornithine deacetylase